MTFDRKVLHGDSPLSVPPGRSHQEYAASVCPTTKIIIHRAMRGADAAFIRARIYTLDGDRPPAEAVCWAAGRILAVGDERSVLRHRTPATRIFDLKGATVLPGLHDAHGHLLSLGRTLEGLNLEGARSFREVIARVRRESLLRQAGDWIVGRGWDPSLWKDPSLPTHDALSRAVPDHPVWLKRRDGHSGIANRRALQISGIDRSTPDPPGGQILKKPDGDPSGILTETAMDLVTRKIPEPGHRETVRALRRAIEECLRYGLTCVHDAGLDAASRKALQRMDLPIRIYGMFLGEPEETLEFMRSTRPGSPSRLSLRAIKLYLDGSLGSKTAWMLHPYGPDGYSGVNVTPIVTYRKICREAARRGYQVCTHAIGDRAVREALDVYGKVGRPGLRWRIEHAQFVHPADMPRFARQGVIASVQPCHAMTDRPLVEAHFAQGHPGAYAWRSLRMHGTILAFGTDFPVEPVDPLWNFQCAVWRTDRAGRPRGGWRREECLTPAEALEAMTRAAAFASFQEAELGRIRPGAQADLSVISVDLLESPRHEVRQARVLRTVVGGEIHEWAPKP